MPPSSDPPADPAGSRLHALAAAVRHDFARMSFPAANWVPPSLGPDGKPAVDVLIAGGGMCGQTVAFALKRDGVRNVRVVDRMPYGKEGPWGTYARMEILRSPKHLTGPDIGFPSLTFRAWYEARHGREGWERLYKIATEDWLAYLLWVREAAGIAIENETEVERLEPGLQFVKAEIAGPRGRETIHARKVVLAGGRDGSGRPHMPAFPSLPAMPHGHERIFHSADPIAFDRFAGGSVGVLGASASAFDNAAAALEAGAREVRLFSRRPHLPQINKSKWTVFPGFFHGYHRLGDAERWRIYSYIFSEGVPPPHESVLRCDRHAGFTIHFGEGWDDVIPHEDRVTVATSGGRYGFDAVILATGFSVDLALRPELADFHDRIALWADRLSPAEVALFPEGAGFPYLGPGLEFVERTPGTVPGLGHIHCFNAGSTISHAAVAGDIPGLAYGAERLSRAIVAGLFAADAGRLEAALAAHDDRELEPTRRFVPR